MTPGGTLPMKAKIWVREAGLICPQTFIFPVVSAVADELSDVPALFTKLADGGDVSAPAAPAQSPPESAGFANDAVMCCGVGERLSVPLVFGWLEALASRIPLSVV